MIVNGRDFNFGRCLKIDFFKGNTRVLTVEHAPEVHPDLYIAMDVEVTDMPSPLAHDKPGFMGNVTIFNPSKKLLTTIASGATWFTDFVSDTEEKKITQKITIPVQSRENPTETVIARRPNVKVIQETVQNASMRNYYESRLKAVIYAGYTVKGVQNYTRILGGYVNGSSFSHRGTDDVLKIGIYDIDITQVDESMLDAETEQIFVGGRTGQGNVVENRWHEKAKTKFADTWHNTLEKYIKNFETEWLDDDHSINIIYVKSRRAWLNSKSKVHVEEGVLDRVLEKKLKAQKMPNGGIATYGLAGLLDGLCANASVRVDWLKAGNDVTVNTYVIYPLGGTSTVVRGPYADIQIWNYQNLLETPSIDGAGKMTIKMVFNPQCVCLKTISLMLDPTLKETDVTRNIASFEGSIKVSGGIVGSISSTGNDAAVANNQITGNTNVQSQRKMSDTAQKNGYLFNTGFPIIRVEHTLSTYGPNWTTTVKTVPITSGLRFEG